MVVYRADETGFNIVEMREEVGAVQMRAKNLQTEPTAVILNPRPILQQQTNR